MKKIKPERHVTLNPEGLAKIKRAGKKGGFSLKAYTYYSEMVAVMIYRQYGSVTVDDIRAIYEYYDIPIIGFKWFVFFGNSKKWVEIGTIKSMRPISRKRSIKVWVLN